MAEKLKLRGFNNITKTLCFNLYRFGYAEDPSQWTAFVNERYSSDRVAAVLRESAGRIGANIINISTADYQPAGSSAALLISEPMPPGAKSLLHLDKSHMSAHTYPEQHPSSGVNTLRLDIEISTCGTISPLRTIDYLIDVFPHDIIVMDYIIRGFTRTDGGGHLFRDHEIVHVTDFIDRDRLALYEYRNFNLSRQNVFHTKMRKRHTAATVFILGAPKKCDVGTARSRVFDEQTVVFTSVR